MSSTTENAIPKDSSVLTSLADKYQLALFNYQEAVRFHKERKQELVARFIQLLVNTDSELAEQARTLLSKMESPLLFQVSMSYTNLSLQIASLHESDKQKHSNQALNLKSFLLLDEEFRRLEIDAEYALLQAILFREHANVSLLAEMANHSQPELEALYDSYVKRAPSFAKVLQDLWNDRSKHLPYIAYFYELAYEDKLAYLRSLFNVFHGVELRDSQLEFFLQTAEQNRLMIIFKPAFDIPMPASDEDRMPLPPA